MLELDGFSWQNSVSFNSILKIVNAIVRCFELMRCFSAVNRLHFRAMCVEIRIVNGQISTYVLQPKHSQRDETAKQVRTLGNGELGENLHTVGRKANSLHLYTYHNHQTMYKYTELAHPIAGFIPANQWTRPKTPHPYYNILVTTNNNLVR